MVPVSRANVAGVYVPRPKDQQGFKLAVRVEQVIAGIDVPEESPNTTGQGAP